MYFKKCGLGEIILVYAISILKSHEVQSSDGACGVSKVPSGFIVRGNSFSRGEFPWIVALMQTRIQPVSFFCGGTLISSTFVVTGR